MQEWDGTSKKLALEAKEEGVGSALYGKKMEKKEQEREEQFGGCKETEQRAEPGKGQGRRREGMAQTSGEDIAQLDGSPELAGREGKQGGGTEALPPCWGVGRCWSEVVNRLHSAASPGMAVTPDWELGERVGGLLKQLDPG